MGPRSGLAAVTRKYISVAIGNRDSVSQIVTPVTTDVRNSVSFGHHTVEQNDVLAL